MINYNFSKCKNTTLYLIETNKIKYFLTTNCL